MNKYPLDAISCEAVYDDTPASNPFLAAMPEMLSHKQFMEAVCCMPGLPYDLPQMSSEQRRQALSLLSSVFIPMDYMYAIYTIIRLTCCAATIRRIIMYSFLLRFPFTGP